MHIMDTWIPIWIRILGVMMYTQKYVPNNGKRFHNACAAWTNGKCLASCTLLFCSKTKTSHLNKGYIQHLLFCFWRIQCFPPVVLIMSDLVQLCRSVQFDQNCSALVPLQKKWPSSAWSSATLHHACTTVARLYLLCKKGCTDKQANDSTAGM